MNLFVVDSTGNQDLLNKKFSKLIKYEKNKDLFLDDKPHVDNSQDSESDYEDEDFFGLPPPNVNISKIIDSTLKQTERKKSKTEELLKLVDEKFNEAIANAKEHPHSKRKRVINLDHSDFNEETGKHADNGLVQTNIQKELAKAKEPVGLEKLTALPSLKKKKLQKLNKIERSKTLGKGWGNMPATEVTEEVRNDLKLLQMRSVLDPKRFYKKNDFKVLPKYFQIGTVQHSHLDYYNERHERKNKKHTMVDELLADAELQTYTKRKYKETAIQRNKYAQRKAMKKMKKLKKKK